MLRPWLELARISNLPTVWTNVTAAWLVAGGPWQDERLAWLLLAGSLLYTGGMILNDAADTKFDREHKKERPIPLGKISQSAAWAVGLGFLVIGAALSVLMAGAQALVTLLLVVAILFYDLYHKPWPGAVWVMGLCRTLLCVMAASAVAGYTSQDEVLAEASRMDGLRQDDTYQWMLSDSLIHALGLGGYIVGLTMVARMEAKGAITSPLRTFFAKFLLFSPALVALSLWISRANWQLIPLLGDLTPLVPLPFILVFIGMVLYAQRVMRRGGPAIGQAVGILLAGIAVVDALAVMQVSQMLACGFVALAPLLRFWQRWIAAT